MKIELRRFPKFIIVLIDGEPYPVKQAAERLGMKYKTLDKRIQRGLSLADPVRPRNFGNAAWRSLSRV